MGSLKTVKKFYDVVKVINKNYHGNKYKRNISEVLYIKVGLSAPKKVYFISFNKSSLKVMKIFFISS